MNQTEEKFPIVVFKKGNTFHCLIKELSILESGEDLSQLYEKVDNKKEQLLNKFKEAALEKHLPFSSNFSSEKKKMRKISVTFSLNLLIIMFFLLIPILTITKPLTTFLTHVSDTLKGSLSSHIVQFSHHLQEIPPEKKKELQQALHIIVRDLKPFSEEISLLFPSAKDTCTSQQTISKASKD